MMARYPKNYVCFTPNQREIIFPLLSGTDETVIRLAKQVDMDDLKMANVGGNIWAKVKSDAAYIPEFQYLKTAHLWSREAWFRPTVWQWLCEGVEDWSVAQQRQYLQGKARCSRSWFKLVTRKNICIMGTSLEL